MWDRPAKHLHPTIHHAKKMMQQLSGAGRLALYIDIHGHSSKQVWGEELGEAVVCVSLCVCTECRGGRRITGLRP